MLEQMIISMRGLESRWNFLEVRW